MVRIISIRASAITKTYESLLQNVDYMSTMLLVERHVMCSWAVGIRYSIWTGRCFGWLCSVCMKQVNIRFYLRLGAARLTDQRHVFTQFTYLLTPWSRVLLEKLTGFAANQEIPRILWNNPNFTTVLTSARQLHAGYSRYIF